MHTSTLGREHKHNMLCCLKRIEADIREVGRMVEADGSCLDVLQQTRTIQQALNQVNALMLRNYLDTCMAVAMQASDLDARASAIAALVKVFEVVNEL
ncbi:MAG: transcriptional regulator [Chloroflexi bacterium]|nr:transcriptional regulator [Chloroflexota bacterium]